MPGLDVRILGAPRIEVDGAPFHVDTRKAVALLAYLALEGPQTRDAVATLLWPESDRSRARAALRRTLWVSNQALDGRFLQVDRRDVRLDGAWWCDAVALRDAIASCDRHDHPHGIPDDDCMAALSDAAGAAHGDLLQGFALRDSEAFDEWQVLTSEALRRDLGRTLERLVRGLIARSDLEGALGHALRRVALDPLHEPAQRQLMLLYAWTGRRGDAVAQYRSCVATLERELRVRPLDETTDLYRAVLEDRAPPPPRAPDPPRSRPDPPRDDPGDGAPWSLPLVGRDDALDELLATHAAIGASGRLLAITGEAGVGKTRLVEELARRVGARGGAVLRVRCHPGDRHLAYAPVAEALRSAGPSVLATVGPHARAEAARVVPDLAGDTQLPLLEPLSSPGAQLRFVETVSRILTGAVTGRVAGLLVVDDLHHVDDASLELLSYLATRLRQRPVGLVACWRDEDLRDHRRWSEVVDELVGDGLATVVPLERLRRDDVASLVEASPVAADPERVDRLHRETEGLPLAVVAYLDELAREPTQEWALPRGLQHLFRARLDGLPETARQVMAAAAVIGRTFDLDTVMAASGRTEGETVDAL